MRKIVSLSAFTALLLLSGCSGSTAPTGMVQLSQPTFSIYYPNTWQVAPVMKNGEVTITKQSAKGGFAPTLSIVSESIPQRITSEEYATANLAKIPQQIPGFSLTGSGETVIDGEKTILIGFNTPAGANGEIVTFYQSYIAKAGKGFVVTGAAPNGDTESTNMIKNAITSWKSK